MNTCNSCEHWKETNGKRHCQCSKFFETQFDGQPGSGDELTYLHGDAEYQHPCAFQTGPKFGCVHHKPITKTVKLYSGDKMVASVKCDGWEIDGEYVKNIKEIDFVLTGESTVITHAEIDGVRCDL